MRWVTLFALAAVLWAAPARADEGEASARDIVTAYNTGLRFGLSPGLLIPLRGGKLGFAFGFDIRYGFDVGRVVLSPGVRLGAILFSKPHMFTSFGTLRLTIPAGMVGPYLLGGVGGGLVTHPKQAGFGYLAGAGFLVHIGTRFGVGAESTYQELLGTPYRVVAVGPQLLLAF